MQTRALTVLLALSCTNHALAQTCWQVEELIPFTGGFGAIARCVSADGSVVVGNTYLTETQPHKAFRWTREGGMQEIPTSADTTLTTERVSADGTAVTGRLISASVPLVVRWTPSQGIQSVGLAQSPGSCFSVGMTDNGSTVIVGCGTSTPYGETHRWTLAQGLQNLGTPPGSISARPAAASSDCSVVVGQSLNTETDNYTLRAFRWTAADGMIDLGFLGGLRGGAEAVAVSADGSVVVGTCEHANGESARAFRWTPATGMINLGALPGDSISRAVSVSADGSVVVGVNSFDFNGGTRAFRWTASEGMQDIGSLPGTTRITVKRVSQDGAIVVGECLVASKQRPFRWTQATGMIDLGVPTGVTSARIWDMSADGSVVVGSSSGGGSKALRWAPCNTCPADLDNDGDFGNGLTRDGAVTIEDLLSFLVGFEAGNVLVDLDNGTGSATVGGTPDGAVDINDLLFFLVRFEAGC